MNGPPRKQVMEQLDALRREIAEYHRWLAEFPAVCRVLENIMLRVEQPLPGTELARYRSISNLRDELRAMRAAGVMACRKCGGAMKLGKAMGQTLDCSDEGTCSPAGPGKLIDCMKCEACGWSVTSGVAPIQASSVSDNCDGLILADGYIGGSMLSSPVEHKVTLRYRTCEQADAAFDVISTLIDNANGVDTSDKEQPK